MEGLNLHVYKDQAEKFKYKIRLFHQASIWVIAV